MRFLVCRRARNRLKSNVPTGDSLLLTILTLAPILTPQRFHEVHEAYEVLSNPEQRRATTSGQQVAVSLCRPNLCAMGVR